MHICFVENGYPHYHGDGGGAGTYVQLIGRELVRLGHRVTVIAENCTICDTRSVDGGIKVLRPRISNPLHWYLGKIPFARHGSLSLRYLEQGIGLYSTIKRVHGSDKIDVIEFTEGGDFWHSFGSNIPYIVHLHGSRYTFRRNTGAHIGKADWWHRRLELRFIRGAACVVSPSHALLDIVEEENGASLSHSIVIPYALDPKILEHQLLRSADKGKRKDILFVARNDPVKGAEVLLQAVTRVRENYACARFNFYGFKPRMGEKIPSGVVIHPFVPKEQLYHAYQQTDICVIPSLWDNSPNTVYEAMSAGKAVIASNVGGIPELVLDGITGLLVPPNDSSALAINICRLLADDKLRMAMGKKGRQRIAELANLSNNVALRLNLYRKIKTQTYP